MTRAGTLGATASLRLEAARVPAPAATRPPLR